MAQGEWVDLLNRVFKGFASGELDRFLSGDSHLVASLRITTNSLRAMPDLELTQTRKNALFLIFQTINHDIGKCVDDRCNIRLSKACFIGKCCNKITLSLYGNAPISTM
ncbi:hypothetical protein [Halomonas sp. LBP4]|uniref:hypothetical protein n=1 Tax=Halomonas sp. LBP4 TaxID=2044917 RepID=UPI003F8D2290